MVSAPSRTAAMAADTPHRTTTYYDHLGLGKNFIFWLVLGLFPWPAPYSFLTPPYYFDHVKKVQWGIP
jgi:hypothetical protein